LTDARLDPSIASERRSMSDLTAELTDLVERVDTAILRFDAEGRCSWANRAATDLLGPLAIGRASWIDLVLPEDQPVARAAHLQMVEEGRAAMEVRAIGRDGRERQVVVTLLRAPGEPYCGHHQVVRDVTSERSLAGRIEALTAELARRDRALEDLLAMAAHELSEPVRKVSAFADLIREAGAERLDEGGLDYLERIRRAAARMDRLLRDIMALARVSTSTLPFTPTDLGEAARAALAQVAAEGGEIHAEIDELPTVDADAFQIEQLFACLLSNAIRFRKPDQRGSLRVARSLDAPEGVARVTVSDDGIGFERADAARVFLPFVRPRAGAASASRSRGRSSRATGARSKPRASRARGRPSPSRSRSAAARCPTRLWRLAAPDTLRAMNEGDRKPKSEALKAEIEGRELAEQEARRHQRFLESIVENIPNMIFVKDADELRFVRFNRAAEELLGMPRGELHGKNDHDLFPSEEADFFTAKDREVLAGKRLFEIVEEPIHTRSRGVRLLHTKKIPILDEHGEPEYLLGISEDITDRRRAEEELARSHAELSQFAYVASHDLQEPLRKILAFGQLLPEACGPSISPEARDYLARMLGAATRMQALITDLLAYSRLTTEPSSRAYVALNDVAEETLADLEVALTESRAEVSVRPLPIIEADRTQMRQLLQNLVGNAIKFTKPGEPPEVEISSRSSSEGVEIAVVDRGIGFDERHAERIWRPFQRLHTRTEYPGTGIGLAICKKIAEHHGGTIRASSSPGRGATFVVTFPPHIVRPRS
jgi:PAS domain S-box-containing protein